MRIQAYYLKELEKQFKMKLKNKEEDFLVLLGTLDASLLGNILVGKGAIVKSVSKETKSKKEG